MKRFLLWLVGVVLGVGVFLGAVMGVSYAFTTEGSCPDSAAQFGAEALESNGACWQVPLIGGQLDKVFASPATLTVQKLGILYTAHPALTLPDWSVYTTLTIRRSIPNRTTARQWRDALLETYQQPMHICSRDATHLFPAHNAVCPWCRAGRPKGVSVAPNPTRGPNRPGSAAGGYAPLRTRELLLIAGMVLGAAGGLLFSLLMQPVLSAGCSDPSLIPAGIIGTMPDFGALSLSPALPATLSGIFAGGWQARQLSRKSARHPLSGSLLLALLELVLFLVGVPLAAIWLGGITATVLFCVYALFLLVSLITISVNTFRAAAS